MRAIPILFLFACGEVHSPSNHDDARPPVDAHELDASPDAGLCTTVDPVEQCKQVMLPRCDAFSQCFPGDTAGHDACVIDVYQACTANHLLLTTVDCVLCNQSWHDMVAMTPIPASCKTPATEKCSACYGLASTSAMCPETVPQ